jgi:NAD+ kinase
VIEVKLVSGDPDTNLTIDGQMGIPLKEGDIVRVTGSSRKLRIIIPPDFSYYRILRKKLNWGGSSHYRTVSSAKKK